MSLTAFNKIIIILVSIGALVAVYKLEADTPFLYNLNASFYGLTYIIAVFIIYLYLYSVSEKNQLYEINHTQVQYIEALKANYDTISANETRYKKFVHDVKNHVCTIVSNLLDNALGYCQKNNFSYIEVNL